MEETSVVKAKRKTTQRKRREREKKIFPSQKQKKESLLELLYERLEEAADAIMCMLLSLSLSLSLHVTRLYLQNRRIKDDKRRS